MNLGPSSPFIADPALLKALNQRAIPVRCIEHRILFSQGDECSGLYILHSGDATLTMVSISGKLVARFQTPAGSLLGLPAVLGNQAYSLTATASKGSGVGFVGRSQFLKMLEVEPGLYPEVLKVVAAEILAARSELTSATNSQTRKELD
jgi:CRP-like cAMP-binding protein